MTDQRKNSKEASLTGGSAPLRNSCYSSPFLRACFLKVTCNFLPQARFAIEMHQKPHTAFWIMYCMHFQASSFLAFECSKEIFQGKLEFHILDHHVDPDLTDLGMTFTSMTFTSIFLSLPETKNRFAPANKLHLHNFHSCNSYGTVYTWGAPTFPCAG